MGVSLFIFVVAMRTAGIIKIMIPSACRTPHLWNPILANSHDGSIRVRWKFLVKEFNRVLLLRCTGQKELQFSALGATVDFHLKSTLHAEIKPTYPNAHITKLELFLHQKSHAGSAAKAIKLSHHSFSTAPMTSATASVFTVSIRPES